MAKKRKWQFVLRNISELFVYTLEEAAKEIGAEPGEVSTWVKRGELKPIDRKRPPLFHGTDLKACCAKKNAKRKIPLEKGELLCWHCHAPTVVNPDSICVVPVAGTIVRIEAKCKKCAGAIMCTSSVVKVEKMIEVMKQASEQVQESGQGRNRLGKPPFEEVIPVRHYNLENERRKYEYLEWLVEAKQRSPKTRKLVMLALLRFEAFTGYENFLPFTPEKAKAFKQHLRNTRRKRGDKNLSCFTVLQTLRFLKDFLTWLSMQPGVKKRVSPLTLEFLEISRNERRAAEARIYRKYPKPPEVADAFLSMSERTEKELRDKAMMAFIGLTGVRDGALVTLRIKHVDLENKVLNQNAKEVATKKGKTITSGFFPVWKEFLPVFTRYFNLLVHEKGFGPDDPLFPRMEKYMDAGMAFAAGGSLSRKFLTDAQIPTRVMKEAFQKRGYPAHSPHRLRHTISRFGKDVCTNRAAAKAWSTGLGHTRIDTTDDYGKISVDEQIAIMGQLWDEVGKPKVDENKEIKEMFATIMAAVEGDPCLPEKKEKSRVVSMVEFIQQQRP